MPLKKVASQKTVSSNIKMLVHDYERTGHIGNSTPVEVTEVVRLLETALGRAAIRELVPIQPGEQISTELIGPPTTAYVDSTNCRVLSP